jgi:hypothetical protein
VRIWHERRSGPQRERDVILQHGQHAALYVLRSKGAARKFLSRLSVRRTPADVGRRQPSKRPDRGPALPQPSRGDQDGLEVHDERAAMIVDGRADAFEQTVSDCWFEGCVIAP